MANTRDMEQIEREIERIRRDAGATLDEIEYRVNPRRLMEQGMAALRETYPARHLRETVSDGALPMLLIAAGIGLWAYNISRRRDWGEPIHSVESDEWRSAPTIEEMDEEEVLADESVTEHHVHVADSRLGARTRRSPTPEELLDIEHSHKSASGSARAFRG